MLPGRKYTPEDIARDRVAPQVDHHRRPSSLLTTAAVGGRRCGCRTMYRSETLILVDAAARARQLRPLDGDDAHRGSAAVAQPGDPQPHPAREGHQRLRPVSRAMRQTRPMESVVEDMRTQIVRRHGARRRVQDQPTCRGAAHGDDRHRSAGGDVHRGEPARPRRCWPTAPTSSSSRSSTTRARGWSSTSRSSRSIRRRNAGELPSQLQTQPAGHPGRRRTRFRTSTNRSIAIAIGAWCSRSRSPTPTRPTPERAARPRRGRRPERDRNVAGDRSARTGAQRAPRDAAAAQAASIPTSSPRPAADRASSSSRCSRKRRSAAPRRPRRRSSRCNRRRRAGPPARAARQFQTEIEKLDRSDRGQGSRPGAACGSTMTDYQRRVEAVPGHESELTDLMRDYDTLQKSYTRPARQEGRTRRSRPTSNGSRSASSSRCSIRRGCRRSRSAPTGCSIALIGAAFGLFLGVGVIGACSSIAT